MHNLLRTTIFLLTILYASNASALSKVNPKEKDFANGNEAYEKGNYQLAADIYNQILEDGCTSWQLYYNLANAYYRLDEIGQSIINYKRALRLAPNNRLIKDNLALAHSKTSDNIEQLPQPFLKQWTHAVVSITTPHGWRIILVVILFLLCATLTVFFTAHNYRLRKTMFIISVLLFILTFFSAINAAISAKNVTNNKEAVIIDPMTVVKSSPDPKSVDKFILHEGAEITISETQDNWWQISIADGKSGWINSGAEII